MKKIVYTIAVLLGLNANAQEINTISLRVHEFAHPLVEDLTRENHDSHSQAEFRFI